MLTTFLKIIFLIVGDVGYYDEDGHVIIKDRIKELIKVKGHQVKSCFIVIITIIISIIISCVIGIA